ncbi:MAG: zinc-ribbon domain-containing protein [Burkholderiales bacterium]|nr:zinc-ribbon domain-containing protein [Burkholderiales bacterium]
MSLATRCTSCGTVFRVVQDQLKVSEGWVRCGRCDAVFNAFEGLFDLGRDTPPEWDDSPAPPLTAAQGDDAPRAFEAPADTDTDDDAAPPAAVAAAPEDKSQSSSFPSTAPAALEDLLADPIDAHLFRKRGAEAEKRPSVKVNERDRLEFSDARFDSDLFAENASAGEVELLESPTTDAADLPLESASQLPDFIRRAERRARWRSAPVRVALAAASAIALLLLVVQAGHHFRDTVAARWPLSRPALVAWCKLADCVLEAPRRIDEVLVDSTALTRAIGLDAFILSVTLKSRSALPLSTPSIDLSLTDGNGRLIARRALGPRDFGAASVIAPGAEAPLQLMLNAGGARIAGYTVEIFYP